jgi:chromosome segregation ATPase
MERDVNYALLIIILGLLAAIVGMSIYYQNTYKGLSSAYVETLKKLQATENNLTEKEQQLNQTEEQLNKTGKDFEVLRNKYTSLEREKAEVDMQLLETKKQRDALNQTLTSYRLNVAKLYNDTRSLRNAIDALMDKINANETLKSALSSDIDWVDERMEIVEQQILEIKALEQEA